MFGKFFYSAALYGISLLACICWRWPHLLLIWLIFVILSFHITPYLLFSNPVHSFLHKAADYVLPAFCWTQIILKFPEEKPKTAVLLAASIDCFCICRLLLSRVLATDLTVFFFTKHVMVPILVQCNFHCTCVNNKDVLWWLRRYWKGYLLCWTSSLFYESIIFKKF